MLLTLADFPQGWTSTALRVSDGKTPTTGGSSTACAHGFASVLQGTQTLSVTFADPSSSAGAEEKLANATTAAGATADFTKMTAALDSCGGSTGGAGASPASIQPLALTPPIATTAAYSLTVGAGTASHGVDFVVGHKGTVVWELGVISAAPGGTALVEDLAAKAAGRVTG